jgi:hypothetical protein
MIFFSTTVRISTTGCVNAVWIMITQDVADGKHRLFRIFNCICPSHRTKWIASAESEGSDDPFAWTAKCKGSEEEENPECAEAKGEAKGRRNKSE